MGESDQIVDKRLSNYSWTEKICANSCVGKDIFNTIGQISNPTTECGGNPPKPGDKCVNLSIRIQNLGSDVGSNKVVYKSYACDSDGTYDEPPANPTKTTTVKGVEYVYYGIEECFEEQKELPELCPDSDGTVREGIKSVEVTYGGQDYIAMALCEPSLESTNARLHICGTLEECDYNIENCYGVEGDYGDWWHGCKIPK
jgi:hypothetical protein